MSIKIGTASDLVTTSHGTGKEFVQKPKKVSNYFNIKEGDNVYRLLPPVGDLAESGTWWVKSVVHWGYRNSQEKSRTFKCLGKGCPECAFIKNTQEALTAAEKALPPKPTENDKAKVKFLTGVLKEHNLQITYCVNALSQENKIGLLSLKTTMWKTFGSIFENKWKPKKIHPASVDRGVWVNFSKQGSGPTAILGVTDVKKTVMVDGEAAEVTDIHVLNQDTLNRMELEAFDLNKVSFTLTTEQVQRLVDSMVDYACDPGIVDEVFGRRTQENTDGYNDDLSKVWGN
jgi:hypothetical protein